MCSLGPDIRALRAACSIFLDACRCPLCALPWRKASTFPCGHTFCYDCATATLEGPGISQSECPTCKGKYWKRDLRPNPQMMAVVEHTQKILSIAGLQVVGAASSCSQGGARDSNYNVRHNGCGGSIDGLSTRMPRGSGPGYTGQAHACTGAAVPIPGVEQVYEAKQRVADNGRPTAAGSPKRRRTRSPKGVRHAIISWEPFEALTSEADDLVRSAEPKGNVSSGSAQALETALQPCSAEVLLRGPDLSRSQSDWPLTVQVHACFDGQGTAVMSNNSAHLDQPLPDQMQLTKSVIQNIMTDGTASAQGCSFSLMHALGLVGIRPGHLLPAVTAGEAQHGSQVFLGGASQTQAGRRHGDALASTLSALHLAHTLEGVSATPTVLCVDFAGDIHWRPMAASASRVGATLQEELMPRRNSHAAGSSATTLAHSKAALGAGMDGGYQLPSTVVNIRLDIPSVNNAYLDFHALLEQAASCSSGLAGSRQTAGQHVADASSHGNDERCTSWKEEDAVWLFRRLSELPDPTDQEREALEFEQSHVSMLLEELVTMMAKLEARSSRITAAKVADVVAWPPCHRPVNGLSTRFECNGRQVKGGVKLCSAAAMGIMDETRMLDHRPDPRPGPINEGEGAPATFDDVGTEKLAAVFEPQQLQPQNRLQQWGKGGAPSTPSARTFAGVACGGDEILDCERAVTLRVGVSLPWPRDYGPNSAIQGHINSRSGGDGIGDGSGDQRRSCDGDSGGSCHPLVEVAQEGAITRDLAIDNDQAAGREGRCKRPRTEVASPRIGMPSVSSPIIDLPECSLPRSVPTRQANACRSGQPISLRVAAQAPRETDALNVEGAGARATMTTNMARPGDAAGMYHTPATASTLATKALVPEPCSQRGPDQGLDGVAAFPGEAGRHETSAHHRSDVTPGKRRRSEPLKSFPELYSSNPQRLQQRSALLQQKKVKDAPASLRQTRRARPNDRAFTAAAIPMLVTVPSLEPAAHGPAARRTKPFYVLTSGLGLEGKTRVKELTRRVRGVELLSEVQPQLTHLVVNLEPVRRTAVRTIKYLRAVIQGCWVVGMDWVEACLSAGQLVPEGPYEAAGDNVHMGTPAITRLRIEDGGPSLFSGLKFCLMYVKGSFDGGTKLELEALLLAAGGTLLRRPTHRAAITEMAPLTAAAALFGPAAAADLYGTSTCTEQLTPQPAEGQDPEVERSRPWPDFPRVFVLVAPYTNVDVSRVIREWGCAPVQIQWVFDCISRYELLPLDSFSLRSNKVTADT